MKKQSISEIMAKYENKYIFIWTYKNTAFWAMQKCNRIGVPKELKDSREEIDVFDLLHEIGHMETYSEKQTRAQREYNATQWAINEFNKMGRSIDEEYREMFQKYIYSFTKAKDKRRYELDWGIMDMPF